MNTETPNKLKHITGLHLLYLWLVLSLSIVINWWLFGDSATKPLAEAVMSCFDIGFGYLVLYGAMRWIWK